MVKYPKLSNKRWLTQQIKTKPLRHIAEDVGCSYSAVFSAAKKFNINIPNRRGYVYTEETRLAKSLSQKAAYKKKYPEGRFGDKHPGWKGGRSIINSYVVVYAPNHPRAGKSNRVFEHILVAEKTLGRYLTKDEVVHHINGDKQDNRPENLKVVLRKDHVHDHHISGKRMQGLYKRIAYLEKLLTDNNIEFAQTKLLCDN